MALRRNSAATSRVDLPFHSGRSFQIPKAELRRAATRAAGVRIVRRICAMVGIGSVAAGPALAFLRLDDFAVIGDALLVTLLGETEFLLREADARIGHGDLGVS